MFEFLYVVALLGFGVYLCRKYIIPVYVKKRKEKIHLAEEKRKMEEQERLREQAEKEEREQREEDARRTIKEVNDYFEEFVLKRRIMIDSNIWMNLGYDAFFITLYDQIKSHDEQIELYGPQFDEICNIKNRTKYKSFQNSSARCAINRIEEFQLRDLLVIKPLTVDAEKGAYADPLIIKLILNFTKNDEKVVFISDDIELRIRMRGLSEDKKSNCFVLSGQELIEKSIDYCEAKNLRYEEPTIEQYYSELDENEYIQSSGDE